MKKLVPIKNSVVCKKTNCGKNISNEKGIFFTKQYVDLYEILGYSVDEDIDFQFKVGDIVMSCSTGDEIEINQGEIVYLFKVENIMCKVED